MRTESTAEPEWFSRLVERLRERLSQPLPGRDFHLEMAPSHRVTIDVEQARKRPHKESAVLVLLFPAAGEVATVYTVRRGDLTHHAGQISFPGGRREPNETLEETAIREAEEEIGVSRELFEILGAMTELYIQPSGFIVQPFLAVSSERPDFTAQQQEVERVLEIPLVALFDPKNRRTEQWTIRGEASTVPFFKVADHTIWGATAMISGELLALVRAK
jgi:8-oxo-dGTP pyrophosphatase MutT (NUDIX family)